MLLLLRQAMTPPTDEHHHGPNITEAEHCPVCIARGSMSPLPTFAEMILTAHYQHIWPCDGEPCSCHYFEDLSVIRAALALPAAQPEIDEDRLARALHDAQPHWKRQTASWEDHASTHLEHAAAIAAAYREPQP
jgi:hypothetical protein